MNPPPQRKKRKYKQYPSNISQTSIPEAPRNQDVAKEKGEKQEVVVHILGKEYPIEISDAETTTVKFVSEQALNKY